MQKWGIETTNMIIYSKVSWGVAPNIFSLIDLFLWLSEFPIVCMRHAICNVMTMIIKHENPLNKIGIIRYLYRSKFKCFLFQYKSLNSHTFMHMYICAWKCYILCNLSPIFQWMSYRIWCMHVFCCYYFYMIWDRF